MNSELAAGPLVILGQQTRWEREKKAIPSRRSCGSLSLGKKALRQHFSVSLGRIYRAALQNKKTKMKGLSDARGGRFLIKLDHVIC